MFYSRKFTKHREHGSLNEAGSVQKEHLFTTPRPSPKSLTFATSTPDASAKRSTQRSNRAFLLSRSTVAVATPPRRHWRGPRNVTMTTAKSVSAQGSYITVATASRHVEHTAATAASVQTTAVTVRAQCWASSSPPPPPPTRAAACPFVYLILTVRPPDYFFACLFICLRPRLIVCSLICLSPPRLPVFLLICPFLLPCLSDYVCLISGVTVCRLAYLSVCPPLACLAV